MPEMSSRQSLTNCENYDIIIKNIKISEKGRKMKISQQVFAIFLLTALLLTLTACGASATINKDQKTASWVNVIDGPPADEELFDGIYLNGPTVKSAIFPFIAVKL